jgi:hypothetical protein
MSLDSVRELLLNDPNFILIDDQSPEFPKMLEHFEKNPTDIKGFIARWGKATPRVYKDLGLEVPGITTTN